MNSPSEPSTPQHVQHDPVGQQFAIAWQQYQAVLQYQLPTPGEMVITHTFVPPEARGQGLAGKLTKAALQYAQQEALQVIPACSYVQAYIQSHSEYQSLLRD